MVTVPRDGGGIQALCVLVVLMLIGGLIGGVLLGDTELLNPSIHSAQADKLEAEAEALRSQTAREEQKAAAELQALQARRARLLELMPLLVMACGAVGSIAVLTLTAALAYYLIAKARAASQGQVPPERPPAYRQPELPSPSRPVQGRPAQPGRTSSPIERAQVSPNEVTYDGFLAHFYDYILHPHRTRLFYHTEIAQEVEDVYLTLLTDVQAIGWATTERSGWVLPGQIRGVDDVRRRISRREFYSLASSCQPLSAAEPLLFPVAELEREPVPVFRDSREAEYRGPGRLRL